MASNGGSMLTPRQTEIMTLVAEGYRNKEIGAVLDVDEETVKTHMRKAFLRLEARNRAHAVALWIRNSEDGETP